MAKLAEDFVGLGDHVRLDIGLAGFFLRDHQGELGHLAAELGDDPLGHRRADAGQ